MYMLINVIDNDAIYGYVNYGTADTNKNGGYYTKMRCKKCGAAWLAENHLNGHSICPKCEAEENNVISVK